MNKLNFLENTVVSEPTCRRVDHCHAVPRTPSLVDDFYTEVSTSISDGEEVTFYVDPIVMLFNQERLSELGAGAIEKVLDSLQVHDSQFAELRKNCSDATLIQMIKSRHLQAPSEIKAWAQYMSQNADAFQEELSKFERKDPAPDPAPDPNPTPDNV